ncbi:hypothetical protein KQX54_019606 [Cotesia glomerata]|uniref:Ufm1-specific protease 2 n=1 Tax=Cotesia glomerata TaxID=32391 RepID=A0AAV7IS55_COTGL|nr:hypothetical protein KQX54_019606 [Cotesia glomerata]
MTPKVRISSKVVAKLECLGSASTGRLFGVMCDNYLTVLSFVLNPKLEQINDDDDQESQHQNSAHQKSEKKKTKKNELLKPIDLQLNMPVEIDLCGVLFVDNHEENIPEAFKDIDITDNPLLIKYSRASGISAYYYVHEQLKSAGKLEFIDEKLLLDKFSYVRLRTSVPMITDKNDFSELFQCTRKNEHTDVSTTEEEPQQLNPSVDSCTTVAEDETSNVEDLPQTSGGFDKEQSTSTASTSTATTSTASTSTATTSTASTSTATTSTASTSSTIICLFVTTAKKKDAERSCDSEILSKLQHQTIAYHLPCYALYQSKNKRSTEESTDSTYSKYRQLHQLAFQSISNFIETEIIENNQVMYLAQLFLRYQALLLEFGNHEIDFDDIQDYRCETLQKKLMKKFDMDVSVMANNFKFLETRNDYEFENVAYYLRSCIKNIDVHPLSRNVTADDVIRGECDIPKQLIDFMRNLIEGPNHSDEDSNGLKAKITSICRDIASGTVGFYFPSTKLFLTNNDTEDREVSVKLLSSTNASFPTGYTNAIEVEMFMCITKDKTDDTKKNYAPVLQHVKQPFVNYEFNLKIDSLALIGHNQTAPQIYSILVESVCRSLRLIERSIILSSNNTVKIPEMMHFKLPHCDHLVSIAYADTSAEKTQEYRKKLHEAFACDLTRPYFRPGNAVKFLSDYKPDQPLLEPHTAIKTSKDNSSFVSGMYAYYHYGQDNFHDSGWGCAYRSLQTIFSWFRFQGYTEQKVPTHRAIQKSLVDIGDKPSSFIGTNQWIGSTEVGFVLETLLNVNSKFLIAASGKDMPDLLEDLRQHFQTQGTPVMIGGGVLAHTILGVIYDESKQLPYWLILDPHYEGKENLSTVLEKGYCGWKGKEFWRKDAFYNMCLPQRPIYY